MDLNVTIYGKKNCGHCVEFKEKMEKLGVPYSFVELDTTNSWRTDGSVDAMVISAWYADILPIIRIDDRYMTPFEAERRIKKAMSADHGGNANPK